MHMRESKEKNIRRTATLTSRKIGIRGSMPKLENNWGRAAVFTFVVIFLNTTSVSLNCTLMVLSQRNGQSQEDKSGTIKSPLLESSSIGCKAEEKLAERSDLVWVCTCNAIKKQTHSPLRSLKDSLGAGPCTLNNGMQGVLRNVDSEGLECPMRSACFVCVLEETSSRTLTFKEKHFQLGINQGQGCWWLCQESSGGGICVARQFGEEEPASTLRFAKHVPSLQNTHSLKKHFAGHPWLQFASIMDLLHCPFQCFAAWLCSCAAWAWGRLLRWFPLAPFFKQCVCAQTLKIALRLIHEKVEQQLIAVETI
eukprot:m.109134 g.109134  ORF g.109134 m.109134 type:complete len:310 (+) comp14300_c1_seq1:4225-5154(+)